MTTQTIIKNSIANSLSHSNRYESNNQLFAPAKLSSDDWRQTSRKKKGNEEKT